MFAIYLPHRCRQLLLVRQVAISYYATVSGSPSVLRRMSTHNPKIANVKIKEVIDNRISRKLDENGYMDKVAAGYELK
jgi:hypothetical protein